MLHTVFLLVCDYCLPSYITALIVLLCCVLFGQEPCANETGSLALAIGSCDLWYQIAVRRSSAITLRRVRMLVRSLLVLSILALTYCAVGIAKNSCTLTGAPLWIEMTSAYLIFVLLAIVVRDVRVVLMQEAR